MPVPGPTIIISVEPSSGKTKLLVGDIKTGTSVLPAGQRSARNPVVKPVLSLSWCEYLTIPTVKCTVPGSKSGEEAIEYNRGLRVSTASTNS